MPYPTLHYRPAKNWMNDPNGLCQVDGTYHMYYQYNPHGPLWADMHWGHAVSPDMYHWMEQSMAMTPAEEGGEIHCFSGSCCKDREGKPHFFYTSIGRAEEGRDCVNGAQQWMADPMEGDLCHLKQTSQWALTGDLHGEMKVTDWRDPAVIPYGDGFLMVLGGCVEGRGSVLLYSSPDLHHWTYRHVLLQSDKVDGVPWECPNLFLLDGKTVVFYSPCAQVEYAVGTLTTDLHLQVEKQGVLDPAGRQGFYAPQAFADEAGRMVLFGWMPECDGDTHAIERGWSGVMSWPRALSLESGELRQNFAPGWKELFDRVVPLPPKGKALPNSGHYLLEGMADVRGGDCVLDLLTDIQGHCVARLTIARAGIVSLQISHGVMPDRMMEEPLMERVVFDRAAVPVMVCVDGNTIECLVNGHSFSGRAYLAEEIPVVLGVLGTITGNVWLKTAEA